DHGTEASATTRLRSKVAEELAVRRHDHSRVVALQALLIGFHRAIKSEELRVARVGRTIDLVALCVALAAENLCAPLCFGECHRRFTVGTAANALRLFITLRSDFRSLTLTFRLHALIDRLAVLLRQVGAANTDIHHLDTELDGSAVEGFLNLLHQTRTI